MSKTLPQGEIHIQGGTQSTEEVFLHFQCLVSNMQSDGFILKPFSGDVPAREIQSEM